MKHLINGLTTILLLVLPVACAPMAPEPGVNYAGEPGPEAAASDPNAATGVPDRSDGPSGAVASRPTIWARPAGPAGIAWLFAPDGGGRTILPAGLRAAGATAYFAAQAAGRDTIVTKYDGQDGHFQASWRLAGRWQMSSVAPSGAWLALTAIGTRFRAMDDPRSARFRPREAETNQSAFMILSGRTGTPEAMVELEGEFVVDAISNDGRFLYLIEALPGLGSDAYRIRLYDLGNNVLEEQPLFDKRLGPGTMTGYAWGSTAAADGSWVATLYLNRERSAAFIHALALHGAFSFCIDLPAADGDLTQLRQYALVLGPDNTIYVVNPALGLLAEVNLDELQVTGQSSFPATSSDPAGGTGALVALKPDGGGLFFSDGVGLWHYDRETGLVTEQSAPAVKGRLVALEVDAAAGRLYLVTADGRLIAQPIIEPDLITSGRRASD